MARRQQRPEEGRTVGCSQQQHECLPLPHDSQLLKDLSQGIEPSSRYCKHQEGASRLLGADKIIEISV